MYTKFCKTQTVYKGNVFLIPLIQLSDQKSYKYFLKVPMFKLYCRVVICHIYDKYILVKKNLVGVKSHFLNVPKFL